MYRSLNVRGSTQKQGNYLDRIFNIPSYEYHDMKYHVLINPSERMLATYLIQRNSYMRDSRTIEVDHKVRIFIAWMKISMIDPLSLFIMLCNRRSIHKVTIHVPRSVDKVTMDYINRAIREANSNRVHDRPGYKVYIERDRTATLFKNSYGKFLRIQSIHNHRYGCEFLDSEMKHVLEMKPIDHIV